MYSLGCALCINAHKKGELIDLPTSGMIAFDGSAVGPTAPHCDRPHDGI